MPSLERVRVSPGLGVWVGAGVTVGGGVAVPEGSGVGDDVAVADERLDAVRRDRLGAVRHRGEPKAQKRVAVAKAVVQRVVQDHVGLLARTTPLRRATAESGDTAPA